MRGAQRVWALSALLLLLVACGGPTPRPDTSGKPTLTQKRGGGYYKDDGPGDEIPANLSEIPDAQPRSEPLHRFANRPYDVLGKSYVPNTRVTPYRQTGIASWYGKKFHGQKTSIGETYDMFAMTAAHPTLALPSYVRVRNPDNGRTVVVRVIDRGPFHADRVIDLSYAAAYRLGYINKGSTLVEVEAIVPDDATSLTYAQVKPPTTGGEMPKAADDGDEIERLANRLALDESQVPPTPPPATANQSGLYLQLGAFSSADNADNLRTHLTRELDWLNEAIQINADSGIYRVHLGPYVSRAEAEKVADQIRLALGYKPTFVTR